MIVVMISVPSRDAGLRAMNSVATARDESRILVEDIVMVDRDDDGEVRLSRSGRSPRGRSVPGDRVLGPLAGLFSAPLTPAVAVGAQVRAINGTAPATGDIADVTARTEGAIRDSGPAAFLLVNGVSTLTMEQAGQAIRGSEAIVFVLADEVATLTIGEMVVGDARIDYYVLPEATRRLIRPSRSTGSDPQCDRHTGRRANIV